MSFFRSLFRAIKSLVLPLALGFGLAALGPAGGFLARFGMAIGASVGGFLFNRQRPPQADLGDINQPKSDYDVGVPITCGTMRLPAIYVDGDPKGCIREVKTSSETKRFFTGAVLWCEGGENPKTIQKIWANDDVIFDAGGSTPQAKGFILTAQADGSQRGQHYAQASQKLRNYPGNYKQTPDPKLEAIHGAGKVPGYRGCCYSVLEELSLENWEYSLPNFRALVVDNLTGAAQIVSAFAVRVGIPSQKLSLAALNGRTVRALVTTQPIEAKSLVEDVCNWHFIDLVDCNARVEALDRRNPQVWVIEESELGAHDQGEDMPARVQVRADQARALPSIASLRFIDVGREWEVNSASAIVQNGRHEGENEKSFEIAVAATYDEASNWVKPALDEAHAGRFPVEVTLPFRRLAVGPGDVLQLPLEGDTISVRVTEQGTSLPGPIGCQCVSYDSQVYVGHRLANPPTPRPPTGVRTYDAPSIALIDSVAQSDDDADIREALLYGAMTVPDGSPWTNGTLDFGSYAVVRGENGKIKGTTITFEDKATIGSAFNALPAPDSIPALDGDGEPVELDFSSTLTVDIEGGKVLGSATEAQVLAGANRAFLKSAQGWEILQWQTAAYDAANSPPGKRRYILSGLRRGRRGTEAFAQGHAGGDVFVLLDDTLMRLPLASGAIGVTAPFNARNGYEITQGTVTPQGVNMKPIAPAELLAERDNTGNWHVSWVRRDRKSETLVNEQPPLSDGRARFRVRFYNSSGVLTKAYDLLDATEFNLTAALQTTDFGGSQTTIRVSVQQISSITPGSLGQGQPTATLTFTEAA